MSEPVQRIQTIRPDDCINLGVKSLWSAMSASAPGSGGSVVLRSVRLRGRNASGPPAFPCGARR
jgi:hypothetical protein